MTASPAIAESGPGAFLRRPGGAALAFLVAGAVWFLVGATYGFFSAMHLLSPELIENVPALVFGRSRPAHVNTMIYGFTSSTLIGATLHLVPAVLRTRLWSEPLAWLGWLLWTGAVLSGEVTFGFGVTQGREYAEYVWLADVAIVGAQVILFVNLLGTVLHRREQTLYVSVWYAFGSLLAMTPSYVLGNAMWNPRTGAVSGILDTIFLWFFAHNLVGLLLTPLAIGAAYYVLPRVAGTPLFSHTLSMVGFFTFTALYTHIGGHHMIQAPIPAWLKVISIVDSIAMFIPVAVALLNLWMTIRGRVGAVWRDGAGRLVFLGTLWYFVVCVQGPIQSLPTVQKVTHFNNWVVAHAHIGVLGFSGFIALGALWHVLPAVSGRRLWSTRLVHLQTGLVLLGITGFFMVLTAAGLVQGNSWLNGEVVYRVLPQLAPYYALRALLGVFIFAGALVGLVNLWMTLRHGARIPAREQEAA